MFSHVMMNIYHRHVVSYIKLGPHQNDHAVSCRTHQAAAGTQVVISVTVGLFK